MRSRLALAASLFLVSAACTAFRVDSGSGPDPAGPTSTSSPTTRTSTSTTTSSTSTTTTTTTTTTIPAGRLSGQVVTPEGVPLGRVTVSLGGASVVTDETGSFVLEGYPGTVTFSRLAWVDAEAEWDGSDAPVAMTLEPFVVRGLRVSRYTAMSDDEFRNTLTMAVESTVNTLVFDTKTEAGRVLYETGVQEAHDIGAVDVVYDPALRLAQARARGLYTITRIVSFEDPIRANAQPESKLAGAWVDMTDPAVWEYPLALAIEACELGFDEIQFDYVRFPAGQTASFVRTTTQEERVAAIVSFLTEAVERLHPLGCAVSADIFGIVLSSPDDQGIGQMPGPLSKVVDALSPMLYPSHYSLGWLGFDDPNDHPGPVVADALDDGWAKWEGTALMRPWLQAFYYSASQIRAEIDVTEERGFGWILWNAGGNYNPAALPTDDEE